MISYKRNNTMDVEANFQRLCSLLLIDSTKVLRDVLQSCIDTHYSQHRPEHALHVPLGEVLKIPSIHNKISKLRVLNKSQMEQLYPASGEPQIGNMDITLLTLLIRNIGNLRKPEWSGWDKPAKSDVSPAAQIGRLKMYRNKLIAHSGSAKIEEKSVFEEAWEEITAALLILSPGGLDKEEYDIRKKSPGRKELTDEFVSLLAKLQSQEFLDDKSDIISEWRRTQEKIDEVKKLMLENKQTCMATMEHQQETTKRIQGNLVFPLRHMSDALSLSLFIFTKLDQCKLYNV